MTEDSGRRSGASGGVLARTIPTHNTVAIQLGLYSNKRDFTAFKLVGRAEELLHSWNVSSGHVRTIRLLELENSDTLTALSNGNVAIAAAKERIMQNKRVCEQLRDESRGFIEALDQYTIFAALKELKTEEKLSLLLFDKAKQQLNRDTANTDAYKKLEQLGEKFGTWRVPRYAGFLALNIPIFDPDMPLAERTATMTDIDIEARFETISRTLLDHVDPRPYVSKYDHNDQSYRFMKELDAIFSNLISALSIETVHPSKKTVALPLLDTPAANPPSQTRIDQDIRSKPSVQQWIFSDVYYMFDSVGCVILRTSDTHSDVYLPNHSIAGEPIGTDANLRGLFENGIDSPRERRRLANYPRTAVAQSPHRVPNHYITDDRIGAKTYLEELIESIVANKVIDQLVDQSLTSTNTGLQCPFCGADHNPHQAKCIDFMMSDAPGKIKAWTGATRWRDYVKNTRPLLDEFIAAETPAEDRLAAYRVRRRERR